MHYGNKTLSSNGITRISTLAMRRHFVLRLIRSATPCDAISCRA
jgi:hypothetical protein